MEHVEVLRDIRYSFTKLGGDAADVAALDAAIASLSAPQPPADQKWPPQDWKGMDGAIAWHLIDRHASGWGAVGEMMDAWLSANSEQPPSAPVGVEVLARGHFHPDPDGGNDWEWFDGDAGAGCTECVRAVIIPAAALVQQPAAVDGARFRKAPCYLCGYGGAGYFQPETHPCAALYHAAQQGGRSDD